MTGIALAQGYCDWGGGGGILADGLYDWGGRRAVILLNYTLAFTLPMRKSIVTSFRVADEC